MKMSLGISKSLQKDLWLNKRARKCLENGGHYYGKPFLRYSSIRRFNKRLGKVIVIRNTQEKQKCSKCKQERIYIR